MRVLGALRVRGRSALVAQPARGYRPDAAREPGAECAECPGRPGEVEPERRVERHVTRAHGRETECDRREHERELEAAVLSPDPLPAVRGEGSRDHRGDQDRRGERHEETERQQQPAEELSGPGEGRVEPARAQPERLEEAPGALDAVASEQAEELLGPVAMKSTPGITCSARSPASNGIRLPYDS